MSFTSKNLQSKKGGLSFIKGATLFFLGMSCILFVTKAFEISPSTTNAVQYIKTIFLTTDGSNTLGLERISLDGQNGNGDFAGTITGQTICLPGDPTQPCRTQWPTGGAATLPDGGNSQIQFNSGGVFGASGGLIWSNTNGRLGVHTSAPKYDLSVNGDIGVENTLYMGQTNIFGMGTYTPSKLYEIGNILHIKGAYGSAGGDTNGRDVYIDGGNVPHGSPLIPGDVILSSDGGNVGIGTTTPASLLHVGGTAQFGNNLFVYSSTPNAIIEATSKLQFNTSGTTKMTITSTGAVGIGTTTPSEKLDVVGTGKFTNNVIAGGFLYSSDKRLKTNIISILNPLKKIISLNGYTFDWKKGGSSIGVIAQEVEKVFPEIVNTDSEGYKSVQYGNLVAPLIEAIKELNSKVDAQAKEIATLKSKISK